MAQIIAELNVDDPNDNDLRSSLHQDAMLIVSMWHHRVYGQNKQMYEKALTQDERSRLSNLYNRRLYDWCLRTGMPRSLKIYPNTIALIEKAAATFSQMR
jgi:hypothetical protein